MSASRQARRNLGRSLKVLGETPLEAFEVSFISKALAIVAEDVKLATGRCAACLSTSSERKSCHACSFVRYCNRECQTAGWPSHKLVCKILKTDREIASATKLSESSPLLPLDTIWERLRSGGRVEAFEATAYLLMWEDRCGILRIGDRHSGLLSRRASPTELERGAALWDEVVASSGVALLVPRLASGGMCMILAAGALAPLALGRPDACATIIAAGALPLLVNALALPSRDITFAARWSLFTAADAAAHLIATLASDFKALGPALVDAGAIPALVNHLVLVQRALWQPHWPAKPGDILGAQHRAIVAISGMFPGSEDDDETPRYASASRAFIAAGAVPPLLAGLRSDDIAISAEAACPTWFYIARTLTSPAWFRGTPRGSWPSSVGVGSCTWQWALT